MKTTKTIVVEVEVCDRCKQEFSEGTGNVLRGRLQTTFADGRTPVDYGDFALCAGCLARFKEFLDGAPAPAKADVTPETVAETEAQSCDDQGPRHGSHLWRVLDVLPTDRYLTASDVSLKVHKPVTWCSKNLSALFVSYPDIVDRQKSQNQFTYCRKASAGGE